MEFETGYPTASNSVIKCQEEAVLMNGSILKNVVQHREFQVMIEEEIFQKQGDKVLAMSSSEILNCNPHDPAAGCEGALRTYTGNPTEPACPFRAVREVNGIPQYFITEEGQLFHELNGSQNLPLQCGSNRIKLTNVKLIMLIHDDENYEVKLLPIKPRDVSHAGELHSLSLDL